MMVGNPIPGFGAAMIVVGAILTMGLVLEYMADVMLIGGDGEISGATYLFTLIGVILIIMGLWTLVDVNLKNASKK